MARPLGRRTPKDWRHVIQYPLRSLQVATVAEVNRTLTLPYWHADWDQGVEGSCVGFGASMMMSVLNRRRYAPRWLYGEAQLGDEYTDTPPAEGTSVRAACDVLRLQGHVRVYRGRETPVSPIEGITANRWATTVDEMRTAIAQGIPVSIGVNWYANFDRPAKSRGGFYWVGVESDLGRLRGGHCVCVYGASDHYECFAFKNSWLGYPLTRIPYTVMQRLLDEDGEATLVTDR